MKYLKMVCNMSMCSGYGDSKSSKNKGNNKKQSTQKSNKTSKENK